MRQSIKRTEQRSRKVIKDFSAFLKKDLTVLSWNQFAQALPEISEAAAGGETDVITITSTAPRTRNTSELSAKIQAAGGALIVNANDSNYIVAVNNGLRFSVTRLTNGQYRITESYTTIILLGVAAIIGVVLLGRR